MRDLRHWHSGRLNASLEDAEIRARICDALKYRTSGGVDWKRTPSEWILKNLETTPEGVGDLLHEHAVNGGKIQQVKKIA